MKNILLKYFCNVEFVQRLIITNEILNKNQIKQNRHRLSSPWNKRPTKVYFC